MRIIEVYYNEKSQKTSFTPQSDSVKNDATLGYFKKMAKLFLNQLREYILQDFLFQDLTRLHGGSEYSSRGYLLNWN